MFFDEAIQLLEELKSIILKWREKSHADAESIGEAFRVALTIKESARIMMYENIMAVSGKLEEMFSYMRDNELKDVSYDELYRIVSAAITFMEGELYKIQDGEYTGGGEGNIVDAIAIYTEVLHSVLDRKADGPKAKGPKPEESGTAERQAKAPEPPKPEVKKPEPPKVEPVEPKPAESKPSKAEASEKTLPTPKKPESPKAELSKKSSGRQAKPKAEVQSSISISEQKIDSLMNLIGELVIAQEVVLQNPDLNAEGFDLTNFRKAAAQLSKITTELQDVIMSMHMLPLTNIFQMMRDVVSDEADKANKAVELQITGEDTEIDKSIIGQIVEPLIQMARCLINYSIEESTDSRIAQGKPPKGRIFLNAQNESGKVYISVSDDGQGIAGFSESEIVTEASGQSVGLDSAVRTIQSIGGKLEISSKEGFGAELTFNIPLTLAIINGIVVRVGDTCFVLATSSIKEFVRLTEDAFHQEPSGEEYIILRGDYCPYVRLSEKYKISGAKTKVEDGIIAILEHEGGQVCFLIDELLQEQEIVVKPIPSYAKKVKGISGCTQLGDGSIALILDIGGLIQDEVRIK